MVDPPVCYAAPVPRPPDDLEDIETAAAKLGRGESTIRALIRRQRIRTWKSHAGKPGRPLTVVSMSDLRTALASPKVTITPNSTRRR